MEWMAIAVLFWAASPTSTPPVIQVLVESESLCKDAVESLARDLGKMAAGKSAGLGGAARNLMLTSCIRIAK